MCDLDRLADAVERIADALDSGRAEPNLIVKIDGKLVGSEVGKQIDEALRVYRRRAGVRL